MEKPIPKTLGIPLLVVGTLLLVLSYHAFTGQVKIGKT